MIDKSKIETMMKNSKPYYARCSTCKGINDRKFVPKPIIRQTPYGEEVEIKYVCLSCGAER